jgi:hypothetical protein
MKRLNKLAECKQWIIRIVIPSAFYFCMSVGVISVIIAPVSIVMYEYEHPIIPLIPLFTGILLINIGVRIWHWA